MAQFDRPYTTFYCSTIQILYLVPFLSYLTLNSIRDFEIWVRGHSTSLKLVPFESLGAIPYLPSIVTMALSCIISEIKRDIGRKSSFFSYPLAFDAPVRGGDSCRNSAMTFGTEKLEWLGYPMVKNF